MKVHVDVTRMATTRRSDHPNAGPTTLTIRPLTVEPDENGNREVEVAGPRRKVEAWLKRNGYGEGEYTVVEP